MNKVLHGNGLFGDGLRFVLVGAGNTLFTLLVFQALYFHLPYLISYYLSWAIGFAVLMIAFPRFVFKGSTLTSWCAVMTLAIYLTSLLTGGELMNVLAGLGIAPRIGILITIAFTTLVNFSLSRLVYRTGK